MSPSAPPPAPTIRARIHENAVKRITRTYAATLGEIFLEELQNARRAGATRVRIAVARTAPHATQTPARLPATSAERNPSSPLPTTAPASPIPAVLLSFGENGWPEELVRREDAAGFGFASLSRRGCTVSSRPRAPAGTVSPGWTIALAPEHFLGDADAEVHPDDTAPYPHGTSISFPATESAAAIRTAAENAVRHYPLPVIFENRTESGTAGDEELPRRAFLDGAVHAGRWRGLAFGVFGNRNRGYNDPDLNFHGLTLPVRLPAVETVHGATWTRAGGCPSTAPTSSWSCRPARRRSRTPS